MSCDAHLGEEVHEEVTESAEGAKHDVHVGLRQTPFSERERERERESKQLMLEMLSISLISPGNKHHQQG